MTSCVQVSTAKAGAGGVQKGGRGASRPRGALDGMACSFAEDEAAVQRSQNPAYGLEADRPRREQDPGQASQGSLSGYSARCPSRSSCVYHVQTPRCRPEPVPRGIPARPPHYLLECLRIQDLLPSSRLPVKPSAQAAPHHPDEPAANGGVRSHQFTCDGPYSIALLALAASDQDVPMALPGEDLLIMRQRTLLLVPGRNLPPFGSLAPLRTGARESVMRARDMCPDQNLSANGHGHLKIQMAN